MPRGKYFRATFIDSISDINALKKRLSDCRQVTENNCWEWTGSHRNRYGVMFVGRKRYYVHRISMLIFKSFDLSRELCILHHCDNPGCFNPEHLFTGTKADNTADMVLKMRHSYGEKVPHHKLTSKDVLNIRQQRKQGATFRILAENFKIGTTTAYKACKKETWKEVL